MVRGSGAQTRHRLRAAELHHEHVVEVEVQIQPTRARRRQVGVHLDGMVEREGEVVGQPSEVRVRVMQPLEHHGVAAPVAVDDVVRRDDVVRDRRCRYRHDE